MTIHPVMPVLPSISRSLRLPITDVTGLFSTDEVVDENTPAGVLAEAVARRFELPSDTPFALRDNRGRWLEADQPLKGQVQDTEALTLTPKTHLG